MVLSVAVWGLRVSIALGVGVLSVAAILRFELVSVQVAVLQVGQLSHPYSLWDGDRNPVLSSGSGTGSRHHSHGPLRSGVATYEVLNQIL